MTLILASSSIYRRKLLEKLQLKFTTQSPSCDEDLLKTDFLTSCSDPEQLAAFLAQVKAQSIADSCPQDTIIGSDQLLALDQQILGKAGSTEAAVQQLLTLSGRSHRLITAVCVIHQQRTLSFTNITTMHMRQLDQPTAQRYIDIDKPIDCAGSYKIECTGISLFERIESSDQSAITGLPLLELCSVLRDCGFSIP